MTWSTKDEVAFVASLGASSKKPDARLRALRGYLEGIKRRRVWIGIDQSEVEAAAAEALSKEEAKTVTRMLGPSWSKGK